MNRQAKPTKSFALAVHFGIPTVFWTAILFAVGCSSDRYTPEHLSEASGLYETLIETFDKDIACGDLGYDAELKIKAKKLTPDSASHSYTVRTWVSGKPYEFDVTAATDGFFLSYDTEYKVYAAIVEGGPQANVYYYPTSETEDSALRPPDDNDGILPQINRFSLCLNFNLKVENSAMGTIDRTYDWDLSKTVSATELLLADGQQHAVKYTTYATKTLQEEQQGVNGSIVVTNPWPFDTLVTEVVDTLQGFGPVSIECSVDGSAASWPVELFQDEQIVCSYTQSLPDASLRMNTVTAATAIESIVSGTSVAIPVLFGDAKRHHNCVELSDSMEDVTTIKTCKNASAQYWRTVIGRGCGTQKIIQSEAIISPLDSDDSPPRSVQANVTVTTAPCDTGCTLSFAYWKNHASFGEIQYDRTWSKLKNGANARFFGSGMTWLALLTLPSNSSNAYVQLVHQWIAATLNQINGAAQPKAIRAILTDAETVLSDASPTTFHTPAPRAVSAVLNEWSTALRNYNTGKMGPKRCSE